MFLGVQLTAEATSPLQQNVPLLRVIGAFGGNLSWAPWQGRDPPPWCKVVPSFGLLLSLSFSGLLTSHVSLPVVLGAKLGDCVRPLLSAVWVSVEGKRVACAYLILKGAGAAGGFLLLTPLTTLVS